MRHFVWIVLPLALAALSLAVMPAPFAWAGAALVVLALRSSYTAEGKHARRAGIAVASVLAALTVAESVLPGPPAPRPVCDHLDAERPETGDPFDGVLGYGPVRSTVIPAPEIRNGNEEGYTIDEHGLRRRFPSDASDAVLFFGGSFTYGLSVPDEETAAYLVGREMAEDYSVYNFGYGGYGPHQMLAALQSGRVDEVVGGAPRYVFYQLIDNHVRRTVGNTEWSIHDPRFEIAPDGSTVRTGRMCDPRPELGGLTRLLERSAIYRKATSHTLPAHVDTLVAIVRTARDEIQNRYPGCRFHVLLWDIRTWKTRRMLAGLREAGISVHLVSEILPGYREEAWRVSPTDPHPSPEAHALLAAYATAIIRADG